jgi:hypothetical protein
VITVQARPTLLGMPLFTALGMIGYVGAFFTSVGIIVSIWRSSRG